MILSPKTAVLLLVLLAGKFCTCTCCTTPKCGRQVWVHVVRHTSPHPSPHPQHPLDSSQTGARAQQCTRRSPCQVALGNPLTGSRWSLGPVSPLPVDAQDETSCCAACQLLVGCVLYDFSNRTASCRLHSFSVPLDLSSPLEVRTSGGLQTPTLIDHGTPLCVPLAAHPLCCHCTHIHTRCIYTQRSQDADDDAAAFAIPAGQWSNHQWTGALDAVRVVQATPNPAACRGACLTTCGCTYWQHDADAGRCVLYRQQAQQLSPVLAGAGAGATAGVMFGT